MTTHSGIVIEPAINGYVVYDPVTKQFWRANDIEEAAGLVQNGTPVIASIPRRWVFLRVLRVPDAPKSEVRKVVGLQLEQLLPVSQNDVAFDLHLTHDVTSEGRLAVVYAVQEKNLEELRSEMLQKGLSPVQVLPACIGSALIAESNHLSSCLVVAPSAHGLTLDVVRNGEVVYSRETTSPTDEESVELEISQTLAAAEVEDVPIVAAGGLHSSHAQITTPEHPSMLLASSLAAKSGVQLESPKVVAAREAQSRSKKIRLSALLSLVAVLLWIGVYLNEREIDKRAAAIRARQEAALRTLRSKQSAAEQRALEQAKLLEVLTRAFDPSQPLGDVITVVTNHVTDGMWLTNFSVDRGKPMAVRGTATSNESVSQFVSNLSSDPRFRDVRLLFANNATIETTPVVNFSLQAHVVGNIPIVEQTRASR